MAQIRKLARKGGREVFEARVHREAHNNGKVIMPT